MGPFTKDMSPNTFFPVFFLPSVPCDRLPFSVMSAVVLWRRCQGNAVSGWQRAGVIEPQLAFCFRG